MDLTQRVWVAQGSASGVNGMRGWGGGAEAQGITVGMGRRPWKLSGWLGEKY